MFTGTGIFITSIILVSIISLCFFKKRFWENRYLVLFISGCVALVATLTTNFAIRNHIDTKFEKIWQKNVSVIAFNDSLVDASFVTKNPKLNLTGHLKNDSIAVAVFSHHLFYYNGEKSLKVGFVEGVDVQAIDWDDIYFAQSSSDTLAYLAKIKEIYNPNPNNWISRISLPRIKTIKCLYLPPKEYAAIPDSLMRKISK